MNGVSAFACPPRVVVLCSLMAAVTRFRASPPRVSLSCALSNKGIGLTGCFVNSMHGHPLCGFFPFSFQNWLMCVSQRKYHLTGLSSGTTSTGSKLFNVCILVNCVCVCVCYFLFFIFFSLCVSLCVSLCLSLSLSLSCFPLFKPLQKPQRLT